MSKFVQLAVVSTNGRTYLYALDSFGIVWEYDSTVRAWKRMPERRLPPSPEEMTELRDRLADLELELEEREESMPGYGSSMEQVWQETGGPC